MTIAPIVQTVEVKAPPARAFELFTAHFGDWWPRGYGVGKSPSVSVVLEPHEGGRWFERDAEGNDTQWGKVLAWEPPGRLLLGWQLTAEWVYDPAFVTEVELLFEAIETGGTRVTLEHRQLERFGPSAEAHAAKLNGGWGKHAAQYAEYADSHI